MMLSSLPLIEPRDSHTLWYTPSHPSGALSNNQNPGHNNGHGPSNAPGARRPGQSALRATASSLSSDSLAALMLEERALRLRKQNIASFGYSWIRPAGCAKTMLGLREEEAEREEAANAAGLDGDFPMEGEINETMGQGLPGEGEDMGDEGFERDLDDDIPDAEGLVEEGDEGLEDEGDLVGHDVDDDDGLMGRDLDDDIPAGDEVDDFDDQRDLDDDIPSAPADPESSFMQRDLDAELPEAAEDDPGQQQEWEHTDTEAEDDYDYDDDEDEDMDLEGNSQLYARPHVASGNIGRAPPPQLFTPNPSSRRETEAERLFLQRWSGGASVGVDSSPVIEDRGVRHQRRRSRRHARVASTDSVE